ncbi:unnamed protein product [Ceratitis capitata]|uniref:(Mediterranean fruit fly) hypothetical protein n=1 Tax=Ceratitis capitata TaxID=7213 RepID=A0A811U4R6_CERCA|nr:unnamed protein product [Ceratitis capitata]
MSHQMMRDAYGSLMKMLQHWATAVPTGQMTLMMARVNEAKLSTLNMRMTVLVDEELLILG